MTDMDMLEVLKKQAKVTRSNVLARSKHSLGLLQNRIMYLLFSQIQRNDTELLVQRIPIADIREKLKGGYGSFYDELRKAATDLVGQRLNIDKDNGTWKVLSWVTTAEYVRAGERDNAHDYLEITLHKDLTPHLLQLREKYNSIPLDALMSLTSTNSQRLIDILWHDSFAGERRELSYDIDDLKDRMNLAGKYPRFRDFCRAIDFVQKEFAGQTPLRFSYHGSKIGRSWQHIHFEVWTVRPTAHPIDDVAPEDTRSAALKRRLQQLGYTQDLEATFRSHKVDEIEHVIGIAIAAQKRAANTHKPIANLGGFIYRLLTTGVGKQETPSSEASSVNLRDLAGAIYDDYLSKRASYADERWHGLDDEDTALVTEYVRMNSKPFLLQQLEKDSWQGTLMRNACQGAMLQLGLLSFPQELRSSSTYASKAEHFTTLSKSQQTTLISEVKHLDTTS